MWVRGPFIFCHVPEHANALPMHVRRRTGWLGAHGAGRDERETTSSLSFESDTERDEPAAGLGALVQAEAIVMGWS